MCQPVAGFALFWGDEEITFIYFVVKEGEYIVFFVLFACSSRGCVENELSYDISITIDHGAGKCQDLRIDADPLFHIAVVEIADDVFDSGEKGRRISFPSRGIIQIDST